MPDNYSVDLYIAIFSLSGVQNGPHFFVRKSKSNRSPFRGSGFRVYDFFIFLLLISVQVGSASFKARMNSALDSKSKALTILTVELLTLNP